MGKRILIADDALIMRLLLKNILSGAGYEICGEAENGQAAGQHRRASCHRNHI